MIDGYTEIFLPGLGGQPQGIVIRQKADYRALPTAPIAVVVAAN